MQRGWDGDIRLRQQRRRKPLSKEQDDRVGTSVCKRRVLIRQKRPGDGEPYCIPPGSRNLFLSFRTGPRTRTGFVYQCCDYRQYERDNGAGIGDLFDRVLAAKRQGGMLASTASRS